MTTHLVSIMSDPLEQSYDPFLILGYDVNSDPFRYHRKTSYSLSFCCEKQGKI